MLVDKNFVEERKEFYSKIPKFWDWLYGEEYALYDAYQLTEKDVEEIRSATDDIGRVFFKTASILRKADDEILLQLDFPKEVLNVLRMKPISVDTVIARADWVKTPNGLKLLELNADTPTFIKECFSVNGLVTEKLGFQNPNSSEWLRLRNALNRAIDESARHLGSKEPHVVFTSYGGNIEDRYTVEDLRDLYNPSCLYTPLDQLTIDENGLYDHNGTKIDILYRQTYPIEHLIEDESADGVPIGLQMLSLVEQRKLAILNPPSAFLLQSKAVQAFIWLLHEGNSPHFTAEEHSTIQTYFLPTYLDPDYFVDKSLKYVEKPSFGREGDTIRIFDSKDMIHEEKERSYEKSLPVYQEFVSLPDAKVRTVKGIQDTKLLIGCFLIGGKGSAIGIRSGGQITNNLSAFLPVGI